MIRFRCAQSTSDQLIAKAQLCCKRLHRSQHVAASRIVGDGRMFSTYICQRAFLLAQTLQHAVPQFAEFAIQEMLAPEERQ
jgi:hypothetical protein